MDREEQARALEARAGVTHDEALALLERTGGDVLEALVLLEKQGRTRREEGGTYATRPGAQEDAPPPPPGGEEDSPVEARRGPGVRAEAFLRRCGENCLEIRRGEETAAAVPAVIALLLLLVAFRTVAILLVLGLALGYRYRLSGPDFERPEVRRAAGRVRETLHRLFGGADRT